MKGQSLIELLVGIALGAIFIVGGTVLIAPSLQSNKQVTAVQTRAELGSELAQNVRSWGTGNWNNVLALATSTTCVTSGTGSPYFLNVSSSPFAATTGTEQILLSGVTYAREFCVLDVYRDSSGNATTTASGNSYDPSTKLIDVVVSAAGANASGTSIFGLYLSRNGNNVINQTDWSGGSGQSTPVTTISNIFATSSNVAANASGSLQLTAPVGGSCTI